jgi:hypothetical protein
VKKKEKWFVKCKNVKENVKGPLVHSPPMSEKGFSKAAEGERWWWREGRRRTGAGAGNWNWKLELVP